LVLVLTLSLPVGAAWGRRGGPARRAAEAGTPEAALQSLLDAQVTAWNRGDIEGFMDGYWKSEKTTFAGASGVSRGWQALLERYRRTYPDRAAMGTLTFSDLEITLLGRDAAFVLGRWHLERASGPVGGVFSLVVRKFPDGWRIIHDHTSVVESAPK
jgi:beta-aspartyl-peptidase (threonine type)